MDGHSIYKQPIMTTWLYIKCFYVRTDMTHTFVTLYIRNNRLCDGEDLLPVASTAVDRVTDRRHGLRIRSENDTTTYELGPLSYGPAGINRMHSLSVNICIYHIIIHR